MCLSAKCLLVSLWVVADGQGLMRVVAEFADEIVLTIQELSLQVKMDLFDDRELDREDEEADYVEFEEKLEQLHETLGEKNEPTETENEELKDQHMQAMHALNALRASRPLSLMVSFSPLCFRCREEMRSFTNGCFVRIINQSTGCARIGVP